MERSVAHPGKFLADELAAVGVTPTELARQIKVPPNRISQIISGKRAITGDTALRLSHWFGNQPEFWMALQTAHDVRSARLATGAEIANLPTARQVVELGASKSSERRTQVKSTSYVHQDLKGKR